MYADDKQFELATVITFVARRFSAKYGWFSATEVAGKTIGVRLSCRAELKQKQ